MKGWMKIALWSVVVFGAIFAVFRIFFISFYRAPDTADPRDWANAPNVEPGDYVMVWRSEPHLGDLVQCPDPVDPTRWIVARVIGVGGDKIIQREGALYINNFHIAISGCIGKPRNVMTPDGQAIALTCNSEELGSSRHDYLTSPEGAGFPEYVVPPETFFLMSDNRVAPWSYDSRVVGVLPVSACTRRLALRLWSKAGWSDSERRMSFLF